MNRHGFLSGLHRRYAPRSYLEIGVNDGRGLARSRTRTIGVDPAFKITAELSCATFNWSRRRATTSSPARMPIDWFPNKVIDLTFIDGLHIFEYALRDFINAERLSGPASVVVLDDMLPRSVDEAARDRHTWSWTGDVYKVAQVLEKYRPDLVVVPIDTEPTGLVLVVGLDPTSTVLTDHYDEILTEYAVADPQTVPLELIHRKDAAEAKAVLQAPVWKDLRVARRTGGGHPDSLAPLAALRGSRQLCLEGAAEARARAAVGDWVGIRRGIKRRL